MSFHRTLHTKRSRGFSLIESLVALVVLSTGLLGVAALYVESLSSAQTAKSRTKAVALAADMADRIRSNRAGRVFYSAGTGAAGTRPVVCGEMRGAPAVVCNPQQMADFDIWLWKTRVGNTADAKYQKMGLPGATAEIIVNTNTQPNSFTIRISWSEKNEDLTYTLSMVI